MAVVVEDATYLCESTGVLHRARIWHGVSPFGDTAITACGIRLAASLPTLSVDGRFAEDYLLWLRDQGKRADALCSHCEGREAVWDVWARRAEKKKAAKKNKKVKAKK